MSQSHDLAQTNTSDSEFARLWASFTLNQRKFVTKRLSSPTDTAAAQEIGITLDAVSHWRNRADVNRAVSMLVDRARDGAVDLLAAAVVEAATVKIDGLQAGKDEVKQAAATEILDRVLGKAVQRVAPTSPDGTQSYSPSTNADIDERILTRLEQLARVARERRIASTMPQEQSIPGEVHIITLPIDTSSGSNTAALDNEEAALEGEEGSSRGKE